MLSASSTRRADCRIVHAEREIGQVISGTGRYASSFKQVTALTNCIKCRERDQWPAVIRAIAAFLGALFNIASNALPMRVGDREIGLAGWGAAYGPAVRLRRV